MSDIENINEFDTDTEVEVVDPAPAPEKPKRGRKADPLTAVLDEVKTEAKQNSLELPFRGGADAQLAESVWRDACEKRERANNQRQDNGELGWDGIILEDCYRAISSSSRDDLVIMIANALVALSQLEG